MRDNLILLIIILIISNFFLSFFCIKFFKFFKLYDIPDKNLKKHFSKIPYAGGTIVYINFIIILLFVNYYFNNSLLIQKSDFFNIFLIATSIYLIGLVDDIIKLNSNLRLILLSIFLLIFLDNNNSYLLKEISISFFENKFGLGNYSIFITTLCFLLFIQAFNMLDGINLQAGLYALALFFFSINETINLLIFLTIPLIFFIILNYKNKIFLGDSGTYLLAFIIGIIYIKIFNQSLLYTDQVFLLMSIPGFDMLRLFSTRIYYKKNPFKGDRNHIHHLFLNKFSQPLALVNSFLIIISPLILMFFLKNNLLILILTLLIYIIAIYLCKKK